MSGGFLPMGLVDGAAVRDIWGVERLGRMLATGAVVAYIRDDDGALVDVPPASWMSDDARRFVEAAAMVADDGARFPLLLESRVAGYSLDALIEAHRKDTARRALLTAPANDAGTAVMTAAAEGRARRTFQEIVDAAERDGQRLTARAAYALVREVHPTQSWRNFHDKIWPDVAPLPWRTAGRPPRGNRNG